MPITLEEYRAALDDMVKEMGPALQQELHRSALYGEAQLKRLIAARTKRRTARLIRSARAEVTTGDDLGVKLSVGGPGAEVPYARAQDQGAVIVPRRGKYLTIPFPGGPALTPAGVHRFPNARAAGDLQPFRGRSGRLFLGRKQPDGSMQAWYILHPGPITIRGKHFMRDATDKTSVYMQERLSALLEAKLRDTADAGGSD